ncbi:MAG: Mrp/NBP35 family ATP-binding protein [Chloroflexi bacterium]|nr:Mrp/NBP35 family ATP-binding protein [Chloroflexota bacterium]MBU1661281.1 Mrp/NBP35 family ATP-binding protein [Chloroflexota bacterium]
MTRKISESGVYQNLTLVKHPEMPDRNLVELGMLADAQVEGNNVIVTLALPTMDVPIKQDLIDLVKKAIGGMESSPEVQVKLTLMDANQRATFMAFAKGAQNPPQPAGPAGKISKVVAVMSGKGGVGKSSVAGLLASALRRRGLRVGVLDADITGPSIPMMFGTQQRPESVPEGILPVESSTGIKIMSINLLLPDSDQPVVWRGPLISKAIEQFWGDIVWGDLDYLVVDLPPGTSDAALTVMQSLPLDGIVLVTSPQDLAGMVVRKAANMAKKLGVPLVGLVENMSYVICPQCGTRIDVFGPSGAEANARKIGTPMLGRIPLDTQFSVLCDRGSIEDYHSEAFEEIVEKVLNFASEV